jgi:N-acetylglucosaminyldiphosphoundecaprenol N-acetyl-beta-D-mannosaminyltransferase
MRINICGVNIDRCTLKEATKAIVEHALSGNPPKYVVTPNAHHIVMLQKDAHFRKIYQDAFLVVPDGVSLLWAANFLKTPLLGRVNGTDLFEQLCEVASHKELRIFLLGGRPGAADRTMKILQKRCPSINIVGTYCPPYGFEADKAELELINTKIKAAAPHILFVGLGAPKQEYWMYANYQELKVPISIGIGVSFELVSGMVKRAPIWMQKKGLEWFFRLLVEPGRLWKRYIVGNALFLWLVLKQKLV